MMTQFMHLFVARVLHNGMYKHTFISTDSHSVCVNG